MRVTVLNPIGLVGGAERVLLAGLQAVFQHFRNAQVQLILLGDGPLRTAAESLGAIVELVPLPERLSRLGETQYRSGGKLALLPELFREVPGLLLMLNRLRQRLHQFRPDLVHAFGIKTQLLCRAIVPRGTPVVAGIHDFLSERPLAGKLLRRIGGLTHAICCSHAVKADLVKVLPHLTSWAVQNPVDWEHFCPGPSDTGLTPTLPGVVRVGLVATYANWKGHRLFLEALQQVRDLPIRGYIVGGPIYNTPGSQVTREELDQLAAERGLTDRVEFVPFQRDPAPVYRALDVVVHASTRPEPFGLTILEAMSCGRPVIVSAAGGAVELFEEGVSALGFPIGQASALGDRLRQLVQNPTRRGELAAAARQRAWHFRQERFAQEFAAIHRQIVPLPRTHFA